MIFLSYSWKDQPIAHGIEARLREAGLAIWIDYRDLRPDHDILGQLDTAISRCGLFVSVERPNGRQSAWMRKELLIAQFRKKEVMRIAAGSSALVELDMKIRSLSAVIPQRARKLATLEGELPSGIPLSVHCPLVRQLWFDPGSQHNWSG